MRVAIHQLHYLPWIRYFHKIANCDVFVLMDNIQYNKSGWQNRNKIKGAGGWQYLTVPVFNHLGQRLDEVKIDNASRWPKKHWQSFQICYARAPFFLPHRDFFVSCYQKEWALLNDLNLEMLKYLLGSLGISTPLVLSSQLKVEGIATERLVNICRTLGAKEYLSGAYALDVYLDKRLFEEAGINLRLQHWSCPEYPQLYPQRGFIPDLSIIDLLFNAGPESAKVLEAGGKIE